MDNELRVMLLGATGFIGRHVRDALDASDWRILAPIVARKAGGRPSLIARLLNDERPDVVVNCVGRTHGTASELVEANVAFVADLLDCLTAESRLVHVGSAAEYGNGGNAAIRETDATSPTSPYGATKLAATSLVMLERPDAVVLRVFNPIGRGMSESTMPGRAVSRLRVAVAAGADAVTMGDLSAERDFFAARDVGRAVAAVLRAPEATGIINIGSGHATSARDVVRLIAQAAGFRGAIREEGTGSERSTAVARQLADLSLASDLLGWAPRHTIQDATRELWEASVTPS